MWSCVTRTGLAPSPLKTPRESPQLEKIMYLVLINAQMAVVPDLSSPLATSGIFLKIKIEIKNHSLQSRLRRLFARPSGVGGIKIVGLLKILKLTQFWAHLNN